MPNNSQKPCSPPKKAEAARISKRKRVLFGFVAVGVPFLVFLLMTELVLRAFFPLHTADISGAYVYDEQLGTRLKSGLRWADSTDHYRELWSNSHGTANLQESFEDYDKLVFAAGDSFTQGIGVGFDESYPFQLDLLLNLRTNGYRKRFGIANLGLAAYGTRQAELTCQIYAEKIGKPDIILHLAAFNDISNNRHFEQGRYHLARVEGNPNRVLPSWVLQGIAGTQVGARIKRGLAAIKRRRRSVRDDRTWRTPQIKNPQSEWASLVNDELLALKKTAADLDAHLIISFAGVGPEYDSLRQWAAGNDVAFAHWTPTAASLREHFDELPLNNRHSGGHLRPWVYRLIAEAFAREIQRIQNSPAL